MPRKKQELATMDAFEKRFEQEAQEQYEKEGTAEGNFIGIKDNEFRLRGETLGDVMTVVMVGIAYEHAYFDVIYSEDDPRPPACFAIGEDEEDLEPHETSPVPQCESLCSDCEWDEFGSAENGVGKACRNGRRIALLACMVDEDGSVTDVATDEMPILRVPPTSLKNLKGFIKRSNKVTRRPYYAYYTEIGFDDTAGYEKLTFKLVDKVNDVSIMQSIDDKREEAMEAVLEPIDVANYMDPEDVKKARRGGNRKAAPKKKTAKKKVAKKKAARRSKMS